MNQSTHSKMFRFIVVLTKSHENLNDNEQFTVKDVTIKLLKNIYCYHVLIHIFGALDG